MTLKLPSLATSIAGIALGVLVALNDQVLHLGQPWTTGLNTAVVWAGIFGVSLLAKPIFRSLVKVTQGEAAAISSALTVLQLTIGQGGLDPTTRTILQAVLVVAATLGFGPDIASAVRAERAAHAHSSEVRYTDRPGVDG